MMTVSMNYELAWWFGI